MEALPQARDSEDALQPVLIRCSDMPGDGSSPPSPEVIGFKAHNLARMAALGLPVPPAFVLGTAWCARAAQISPATWQAPLRALEDATGLGLGNPRRPLLLSVRSGAPVSMPGMMETLLNIGLCDDTLPGLLRLTGNPRLAWDAYRRLVAGFGETVMGVPKAVFEADLAEVCRESGADEAALDFIALRSLTQRHRVSIEREAGRPFPQDVREQLAQAIDAVMASWHADKARTWRRLKGLDDAMGTAVTVQRMVFGNAGGGSGAGVGFTRHPSSGEPAPWVDFLFNAQGEDVVSGRRSAPAHDELARVAPAVWQALQQACRTLEAAFGDMQDFEFTVENGALWLLQTRSGKRTPQAAARIALDMADEGLISRDEALRRTAGLDADTLALTRLQADDGAASVAPVAQALPASNGVAVGEIALDEARALARAATGAAVLLLRHDAETRDIAALEHCVGLLTVRGARTAHAAVVARQLGKVCLVACDTLQIDLQQRRVRWGGDEDGQPWLPEGALLTLDGNTGAVYTGALHPVSAAPADLVERLQQLRAAG